MIILKQPSTYLFYPSSLVLIHNIYINPPLPSPLIIDIFSVFRDRARKILRRSFRASLDAGQNRFDFLAILLRAPSLRPHRGFSPFAAEEVIWPLLRLLFLRVPNDTTSLTWRGRHRRPPATCG